MAEKEVGTIWVVGAGQMGSGIAQTAAMSGFDVILQDMELQRVERGLAAIHSSLSRLAAKGRLTEEQVQLALERIQPSDKLEEGASADLIIEAIPERMELKKSLFQALDRISKPDAILATNTSSLSITEIAGATARPGRVIGMHFMSPVPLMPLVEIIRGLATEDQVCRTVMRLAERLGKTPVEVKDFPGFVSNRLLMPMLNEAMYAVYEGVASPEAIDQVMKLGMNHPMGPLALADRIGLDTCLAIMETLQEGFGDSKYRPCPLLRSYVAAGWLGHKTGRGFYTYSP